MTIDVVRRIQASATALAQGVRLPLRNKAWRGLHGNWSGVGSGSSIDFQDHRPYLPGDDPRYIDWQAFARSGNYTLKVYQEEVSPAIDLVLDGSASMFLNPAKTERTAALFYFAIASAQRSRGALRVTLLAGPEITPLTPEAALLPERFLEWMKAGHQSGVPPLDRVPWRKGSLRVWISDLLFPGAPLLFPLAGGRAVVLAPWSREEAEPEWAGNMELLDCETGQQRRQRVSERLLDEYRRAYERHFGLWQQEAARHQVALARVEAETDLLAAVHAEALPKGALELV